MSVSIRRTRRIVSSFCHGCDWQESEMDPGPSFRPGGARHALEDGHLVTEVTLTAADIAPAPDIRASGAEPVIHLDCRDGRHRTCTGEPCQCPDPGVHGFMHEYERMELP